MIADNCGLCCTLFLKVGCQAQHDATYFVSVWQCVCSAFLSLRARAKCVATARWDIYPLLLFPLRTYNRGERSGFLHPQEGTLAPVDFAKATRPESRTPWGIWVSALLFSRLAPARRDKTNFCDCLRVVAWFPFEFF